MSTQRSSFETVDFTMGQRSKKGHKLCICMYLSAINVDVYILIGDHRLDCVEIFCTYMKKWSGQEKS